MLKKIVLLMLIAAITLFSERTYSQTSSCDASLEILANITGHDMYTSFVHLGTLADAYMYKAYTANFALKLLSEYIDYMDIILAEIQKMIDLKVVTGSDVEIVKIQIEAYNQLKTEAVEFKKYVETGESKYIETYETARRMAWKNIAQILGLPQDVDPAKEKKKN